MTCINVNVFGILLIIYKWTLYKLKEKLLHYWTVNLQSVKCSGSKEEISSGKLKRSATVAVRREGPLFLNYWRSSSYLEICNHTCVRQLKCLPQTILSSEYGRPATPGLLDQIWVGITALTPLSQPNYLTIAVRRQLVEENKLNYHTTEYGVKENYKRIPKYFYNNHVTRYWQDIEYYNEIWLCYLSTK